VTSILIEDKRSGGPSLAAPVRQPKDDDLGFYQSYEFIPCSASSLSGDKHRDTCTVTQCTQITWNTRDGIANLVIENYVSIPYLYNGR
jgi:hypothetical protein